MHQTAGTESPVPQTQPGWLDSASALHFQTTERPHPPLNPKQNRARTPASIDGFGGIVRLMLSEGHAPGAAFATLWIGTRNIAMGRGMAQLSERDTLHDPDSTITRHLIQNCELARFTPVSEDTTVGLVRPDRA